MEELFNKPILDQMYEFRKEYFEQIVYENNKEISKTENESITISEEFASKLKQFVPKQEDYNKATELLKEIRQLHNKELEFWKLIYFKLGMIEREKIRNEFFKNEIEKHDSNTFINYEMNGIDDYIEEQKSKYCINTKEYKELQKEYNKIINEYPNVKKFYEELEPVLLNKEEINALIRLRNIDISFGNIESKLCFKLGMMEVINF